MDYLTTVAREILENIRAGNFPRFVCLEQIVYNELITQPENIDVVVELIYKLAKGGELGSTE